MEAAEKLITENVDTWTAAIRTKSSAGRGSGKKRELYGIDKLRELILELAIRGLIVLQDSDDEPASKLMESIADERALLIEDGTIKKKKLLPPINEDEKPFDLPSNWEWLRLNEVGHDWGQKKPDSEFTYIDVGSINKEQGIVFDPKVLSASDAPSRARKIVKEGTVIYSTVRPYLLNIAVVAKSFEPLPIASTAFAIVHPFQGILASFIYRYLRSPTFINYVESCQTGIAYPAINDKQFFAGVLPLPPLAEQHRIVAKVDELMALCDQLEQEQESSLDTHDTLVATLLGALTTTTADASQFAEAWQRIQANFDTLFTTESSIDQLKQTILQLAVMGKLVPQDPEDEPADDALSRIALAKNKLQIAGEIPKEKKLSPLDNDTLPFEVPPSWRWVQLAELTELITKGSSPKWQGVSYVSKDEGILFITSENVGFYNLRKLDDLKYVEAQFNEIEPRSILKYGDILMNLVGASIGRTALYNLEDSANINQAVALIRLVRDIEGSNPGYLLHYFNSPVAINHMLSSRVINAQPNISLTNARNFTIPFPPLAEQHRIVAKVDELMALCDQLKASLATAQATQLNLADSLVEQAIG